jgi:nitrate reductase NapE component
MEKSSKPSKEKSIFIRFALLALVLFLLAFILRLVFY